MKTIEQKTKSRIFCDSCMYEGTTVVAKTVKTEQTTGGPVYVSIQISCPTCGNTIANLKTRKQPSSHTKAEKILLDLMEEAPKKEDYIWDKHTPNISFMFYGVAKGTKVLSINKTRYPNAREEEADVYRFLGKVTFWPNKKFAKVEVSAGMYDECYSTEFFIQNLHGLPSSIQVRLYDEETIEDLILEVVSKYLMVHGLPMELC